MWRVEFFKIGKRDFTFIREMRVSKLIGANLEVRTLGEVDGNGNENVIIWKWRPTTKSTVGQFTPILQTN